MRSGPGTSGDRTSARKSIENSALTWGEFVDQPGNFFEEVIPPLWKPHEVDEILTVTTDQAKAMARRLALEEGVFAGTSSGANVVAALRVAARLGTGSTVVTLMCDSGLRYLSTDVFQG